MFVATHLILTLRKQEVCVRLLIVIVRTIKLPTQIAQTIVATLSSKFNRKVFIFLTKPMAQSGGLFYLDLDITTAPAIW